ncbi:MAG: glutamate 5-kinase, partial [Candidatus Omnitrophica bacterium]|nr:glutamate 5-kinase [Candidatus Omnitrophota bacterium]
MKRKELIKKAKTIVVKVGTRVLTKRNNELDTKQIRNLVNQLAELQGQKYHLLVVSSGAIGAGMGLLGIKHRPESLPLQQAMAAIGQSRLMRFYDDYFKKKGILTAQVLLTSSDLEDRQRYLNASNT